MPDAGEPKKHIIFSGRTSPEDYTSPQAGGNPPVIMQRNPSEHGQGIKAQLEAIQAEVERIQGEPAPQNLIKEDVVYVDFVSDFDVKLAFDSFEDGRYGDYHLIQCLKEGNRYRALVALNAKGISRFIKYVEEYSAQRTKGGNPKHGPLISTILDLRLASLRSFWNEPTLAFPEPQEEIWWEVWIRREDFSADRQEDEKVVTQLIAAGATVGDRRLLMPEHVIRLVRATPDQLSTSLLLLDNLAELRKAKDTAEFFTDLRRAEQQDWVDDLIGRIQAHGNGVPVAICILDTGVNNGHPLLNQFLPNVNMDSVNPAWGNQDGHGTGHGTQMAGLAIYGDLTESLVSRDPVQIFHQLESIKLFNAAAPHAPEIYGQVTIECVNRAIVMAPGRKRIFCMAVTSADNRDRGKPSSWSSAVDKITFGDTGITDDKSLLLVSVGNVEHNSIQEYPARNKAEYVHDPSQAYNTVAVGGYTEKDSIDLNEFPASVPLARRGDIAPSSSTSCLSDRQWPIKPDIVMEAGNYGVQNGDFIYPASLNLLTTAPNFDRYHFTDFRDTSAATALASNLCVKIYQRYSNLWPESVRGILVHSANWTPQMLGTDSIGRLTQVAKKDLLRTFGYGVPDVNKALYSLNNSLTLVAQREIQPYMLEDYQVKTNHLHIFDLPWPEAALAALGERQAKLTLTLSYFIEPNPGNRYFSSKFTYQSHGLRFKVRRPLESLNEFRTRINSEARQEDEENVAVALRDNWQIGEKARNVGSLHKDIWIGTGVELASMKNIAVYPVNGWWRLRKKLNRYDKQVRYSLIVTIETDAVGVDLYTPVENMIAVVV